MDGKKKGTLKQQSFHRVPRRWNLINVLNNTIATNNPNPTNPTMNIHLEVFCSPTIELTFSSKLFCPWVALNTGAVCGYPADDLLAQRRQKGWKCNKNASLHLHPRNSFPQAVRIYNPFTAALYRNKYLRVSSSNLSPKRRSAALKGESATQTPHYGFIPRTPPRCRGHTPLTAAPVSYTHLTLPMNREV